VKAAVAPHRPLPWGTAAAVAAAGALLVALWRSDEPRPAPLAPLGAGAAVPAATSPSPAAAPVVRPAPSVHSAPPSPPATLDATAPDLRRLYDQYAGSGDPRARRMAMRAVDACVPLFVPPAGETPSPEPLIAALPANGRDEREQAWRTLFARCHGFVGERPDAIAAMQSQSARDVTAQDPGARARQALVNGDAAEAGRIAADALTAADPAAIASLSGVAIRLAQSRGDGSADMDSVQRAMAVDAALPLVACDLGLDCSAQSLAALQLCAVEGACSGDLRARLATRLGGRGPDLAAIEAQRERLRALLASDRSLALEDLLPAR
jgi:hypothetical protein